MRLQPNSSKRRVIVVAWRSWLANELRENDTGRAA